jgi:hypothetical protein
MKPYGVPRVPDVEYPDVADIQKFGLKSSIGRIAGKGGDIKGYQRPNQKAYSRRIWKKKIRKLANKEIEGELKAKSDEV